MRSSLLLSGLLIAPYLFAAPPVVTDSGKAGLDPERHAGGAPWSGGGARCGRVHYRCVMIQREGGSDERNAFVEMAMSSILD